MALVTTPHDNLAPRRVRRANGAISPLRANLVGVDQATCGGITVSSRTPVLALCRALIKAGHDPNASLQAYRGEILCLRVRSLADGAALTVEDGPDGKPRFAKLRGVAIQKAVQSSLLEPRNDFAVDLLPATRQARRANQRGRVMQSGQTRSVRSALKPTAVSDPHGAARQWAASSFSRANIMNTKPKPRTYADAQAEIAAITMEIEDLEYRIDELKDEIEPLEERRDRIKEELDDLDDDEQEEEDGAA
jgi:hypothetical protein